VKCSAFPVGFAVDSVVLESVFPPSTSDFSSSHHHHHHHHRVIAPRFYHHKLPVEVYQRLQN